MSMSALLQRIRPFLALSKMAPLYLPLPFTGGDPSAREFHWKVTRIKFSKRNSWKRRLYYALLTLLWPILSFFQAILACRDCRNRVYRKSKASRVLDFFACWGYSIYYLQPAYGYFLFRLGETGNRKRRNDYVHNHENEAFLPTVNQPEPRFLLRDKLVFWEECRKTGLSTVSVLAEVVEGRILWMGEPKQDFPPEDLFLKQADYFGGINVERFDYTGGDDYRTSRGLLLEREEMASFIRDFTGGRRYLLQPRVINHPELAQFSQGGVCTIRVATFYDSEIGKPRIFAAVMGMPRPGAITDNFARGGAAAAIDLGSGQLGEVVTRLLDYVGDRHPDTGENVTGSVIPYWDELVQLCMTAQAAFRSTPTVAWDTAVTEGGPLLLEGNTIFGTENLQIPHNRPITETGSVRFLLKAASKA